MAIGPHAVGYLLLHFPELTEQARQRADDAINGNRGRDLSQPQRRPEGLPSDPTLKRGLQLAEATTLADHLARVRQWIDTEMPADRRHFLITLWRQHRFGGWNMVAKCLEVETAECLEQWDSMVDSLKHWLEIPTQSAGGAQGQPGDVFVAGRPNDGRE